MLYLVIDIGNTLIKLALYKGSELVHFFTQQQFDPIELSAMSEAVGGIDAAIVSSTAQTTEDVAFQLKEMGVSKVVEFSHLTPIPIKNCYHSPQTLGLDRLAAAVWANHKFPEKDVIIFDLGTAITIDYVSKDGEYMGGNISPGLAMRFKALNHFTGRLPLIEIEEFKELFEKYSLITEENKSNKNLINLGTTTISAIYYGVVEGICNEIEGYLQKNDEKIAFFTGGDALFFEKLIKIPIFVDWQTTLNGLQVILERICTEKF